MAVLPRLGRPIVQCRNHPPLELTAPRAKQSILQENACHACRTKQISWRVAEVSGGGRRRPCAAPI